MKQIFKSLTICMIAVMGIFMLFNPLDAKAYDNTIHIVEATDTTLTIDWTRAAEQAIQDRQYEGYTTTKYTSFKLGYTDNTSASLRGSKALDVNSRRYTITGLRPNTCYKITVDWNMAISRPGSSGSSSHNFQNLSAYTTGGNPKTAKLLGTTGSTATVDLKDAIKEIEETFSDSSKYSTGISDLSVGYADQEIGDEAALKKAKEIAGKRDIRLDAKQGTYQMRGLKPDHSYTFVALVKRSARNKENDKYEYISEYIQLTDIKTTSVDDSAKYNYVEPDTSYDNRKDALNHGRFLSGAGSSFSDIWFQSSVTETSITIDWSNQKDSSMTINPAKGESMLYLSIVKEKNYDYDADRKQNGPVSNYGPNIREAADKADAHMIQIPTSQKSYTFENLEPGGSYTVMMKCSYKKPNLTAPTIYPYLSHVITDGGMTMEGIRRQLQTDVVSGYMYDVDITRQGTTAQIDWTYAINNYCSQSALDDYYARPYLDRTTWIGYAKLPDHYSKYKIKASYSEAEKIYGIDANYVAVQYPYTNTIIYNLDPDAKYVFCIKGTTQVNIYGQKNSINSYFYADETGINFLKADKTGARYGLDTSDPGSGSSGSGSSGSGSGSSGSGDSGSGSSESGDSGSGNSGSGESGSGSSSGGSGSSGSGSDNSGSDYNRPDDERSPRDDTPYENGNSSSNGSGNSSSNGSGYNYYNNSPVYTPAATAGKKWKSAGKRKANSAWISYDKDKISAKKLKKKAQTVTIKIENSKGKIKVEELAAGKNKGVAKIKIKGRKATVKFNKGTEKGTYRFKVTVGAKGKTKATTKTIKIKVK
ncbi:fibronectin type III domain-containing protein [Butyrivibrio sp. VCD2006]|uniref:fibronectin type III domain-containing protein n=1 Tax=Butyrivibrio sp. VCD2006 TaxID=1280664 RepID=UPI0003F9DB1C|nr:fibronectin type III domain-containing protein [Butyrivibrio sp. VCD2006]